MRTRLKKLRKALHLNQKDFGAKLGISDTAISKLETGENKLTEQNINLICMLFNVNGEWLRTGKGEMFTQQVKTVLGELKKKYTLDNLDINIIETYLKLEPSQRKAIKEYVFKLADSIEKDSTDNEQAPTAPNIRKVNISAGVTKRNDDKEPVWSAARSIDNNSPAGMTDMSKEDLKELYNASRIENDDDL